MWQNSFFHVYHVKPYSYQTLFALHESGFVYVFKTDETQRSVQTIIISCENTGMSVCNLHQSITPATILFAESAIALHRPTTTAFSLFCGNLQFLRVLFPLLRNSSFPFPPGQVWLTLLISSQWSFPGLLDGVKHSTTAISLFSLLQFLCPKNILSILTKAYLYSMCRGISLCLVAT